MHALLRYLGNLRDIWEHSGILGSLLVLVWLLYPVTVVTVIHPADAVGFQAWLQGLVIPHHMTQRMLLAGEATAFLSLVALSLFQLGVVVLIYRRANKFTPFWPLATFLVGGIANGVWWLRTGYFDLEGALAGLTPLVAAVVCHAVCERLGKKFVLGPNAQQSEPGY